MDDLTNKALKAKRESKYIEFKERFDLTSQQHWIEIIKDILAITNSGGGIIVIGLKNNGSKSHFDITELLELDPASITDKVFKYTGYQFNEFEISELEKNNTKLAAIRIFGVSTPIVFQKPGTYDIGEGKQKNAFSQGTVYFRHGAKSEPGNTEDLRRVIDRQIKEMRSDWLKGVRKVVSAPRGSEIKILPKEVYESNSASAIPIRIVDDSTAPAYRRLDYDETHPYRQTELINLINRVLPKGIVINSFDILAIRSVYKIDQKDEYIHKPKFGTNQYSDKFAEWIADNYKENNNFFLTTRIEYRDRKK